MLDACGHELDLLVVPTPISLHAEMHRAGVERGIAVYLEKPPTLDHRELERMIATDRAAKKTTLVGFNFIIERPRLALKQRILSGDFGALREVRLNAQWPRPTSYFARNNWAGRLLAPDGGVILDSCFGNAMAHFVHNLLFWAGTDSLMSWGQPETVRAELYRAHEIQGADTFFLESRTAVGAILRFALTHACDGGSTHAETVICEKASIHYTVGQSAEIRWNDGRVEPVALNPFNALHENHLDYYRYLRGESPPPRHHARGLPSFCGTQQSRLHLQRRNHPVPVRTRQTHHPPPRRTDLPRRRGPARRTRRLSRPRSLARRHPRLAPRRPRRARDSLRPAPLHPRPRSPRRPLTRAPLPQKTGGQPRTHRVSFPIMSQPSASQQSPDIKLEKLTSPVGMAVDAVLVIGFFVFLFTLLKSHVPSDDVKMVYLFAGLTAACMSGVFWLAIQMFRVVLSAQLLAKKLKR